jgi:predicted exporter
MFHAMGLILVLCIGIDYALFLYWRKAEEKELLLLGNALAAITTILSFGLLVLSTTTAVYSFGMTVFIGIALNFFITTLLLGYTTCKKS